MTIKEVLEVFEVSKATLQRAEEYKVPLAGACWSFVDESIDRLKNEGLEQ